LAKQEAGAPAIAESYYIEIQQEMKVPSDYFKKQVYF
jgi:hypothetical protein